MQPPNTPTFFTSANVDEVMEALIRVFEQKVFPEGAPALPTADLGSGDAALAATSSGLPLVANAFSAAPLHIPNAGDGATARHSYKSELVLVRDPGVGTKKILWWHADDPREIPHNHPWNFRSAILRGGYTEERFWLSGGRLRKETKQYTAGMINDVPADVFHNVRDVLPGTVTYMSCGPARAGNEWGYLDTGSLAYHAWKDVTPPNFMEAFQALNPHTIKKP